MWVFAILLVKHFSYDGLRIVFCHLNYQAVIFRSHTSECLFVTLPVRRVSYQGEKWFKVQIFGEKSNFLVLCDIHVNFLSSKDALKVHHPIKLLNIYNKMLLVT